ncbi:glycine betaine ABC transporter substrate-binding protein [Rothia uropygialis]|uniref:glycine betaine ABC transporter substrate-binding protein n=1 Tax=Kocuria sp. 36 TaxID=1415402 RepID=UPI00101C5479|nr:glycine betaine ABC transporter substrate-binding protein [Kocuria sp. 36]
MFGKKKTRLAALGVIGMLALSGCGLQPATSTLPDLKPGSIKSIDGAGDQKVTVTSKNFTEQLVLGKIAVLTADAAGFDVSDMTNVPGSQPSRNLMVSGQAQLGWEYTGTAWLTYMGETEAIPDAQQQWEAVKKADEKNNLTWGKPAPLNNTYAFAVRQEFEDKYGVKSLDDIAKVPVNERTFCVESEFNSRSDGFNPMLEKYGLQRGAPDGVPESNVSVMDTGTVYAATAKGDCNFGEVFTTDGRIPALNLTVLQDDREFFPKYNGSPVFNSDLVKKYPELQDRFEQVSKLLDDKTMQNLNYKVDVEGQDPGDVALDWMVDKGLVGKK